MSALALQRPIKAAAPASASAVPLRRKCACASASPAQGECSECAQKQRLQRRGEGAASAIPDSVHQTLRAHGEPLAPSTRAFMQQRIGHDFSNVRVHTDGAAAASARAVNAQAYTVGSNIVFDRGRYQPHTQAGTHLLAHELAHVAQQGGGARSTTPQALRIGDPGDAAEAEADHIADGVLSASARNVAPSPRAPVLARQSSAPPNPYTQAAAQAPAEPAPQAEQSIGDVTNGSWGKFSAELSRREAITSKGALPCTLFATMRIKFVQKDPAAWPAGRFAKWQQEAAHAITERWSMRYLLARSGACAQKNEPCQRSTVVVRLQPVTSGEHHAVSVRYNKPGDTRSDASDWYESDVRRPRSDMRISHATATHEFGHLLGLDHVAVDTKECKDARVADPKNPEPDVCYGRSREERAGIMGAGEIVRPQDYTPFLAPMQTATGCSWRVDGSSKPTVGTSGLVTGLLVGGLLGLAGGAALGAMLGPVGMLVGGLVGAVAGGLLGAGFGSLADE